MGNEMPINANYHEKWAKNFFLERKWNEQFASQVRLQEINRNIETGSGKNWINSIIGG